MNTLRNDPMNPASAPRPEVPLSIALVIGGAFLALLLWLQAPRQTEQLFLMGIDFIEANRFPLGAIVVSILFNVIWIGTSIKRTLGFRKQGAKLSRLAAKRLGRQPGIQAVLIAVTLSCAVSFALVDRFLSLRGLSALRLPIRLLHWELLATMQLTVSAFGVFLITRRLFRSAAQKLPWSAPLPKVPNIRDGIVLGTINEKLDEDGSQPAFDEGEESFPNWLTMGLKALTGNVFIAGVIGSGKSQVLLQMLRQTLKNFSVRPSLLAIDPKRTFVRELRKIIEELGMQEHLLWVELDGAVKFNPIWREKMLKGSAFTTIANTLKLASINFLGSSPDNRFWEQSSFNLLKNSLIYCAARYDYFTFKELYRALVQARDEGLAAELVDHLNAKPWDEEERANIEMAVDYFKDEFSQMDEKVRTSVLATATSFLNEFLEYSVSRILSPKREEISLLSVKDAIRDGKLICLHIENDSLARSVGTLLKLLYEEAVLERVSDPGHAQARYAVLVMDEYQDVATSGGGAGLGDDRYLAKARESKAITIAATQSVSSLENAIRSEAATRELLQNFRSRVLGNTTDTKTIRLFQEPRGMEDVERHSLSRSENAQDARPNYLFGGINSKQANISESVSTQFAQEYRVTAKEFSRLRTFEAFAQTFDGLETRFEKVYLKPYYLADIRTSHQKILSQLRESAKVPGIATVAVLLLAGILPSPVHAGVLFPNICTVVKTGEFNSCLDFSVSGCMCGWPIPRPCAQISYYVPQTFIEVWPNSQDTFFTMHPGVAQLKAHLGSGLLPFGTDDESSGYSFQAHAMAVPLTSEVFMPLPCGGPRTDKPCFDALSEDFGANWRTGKADFLQPSFLAWGLSPKACILKGAAESAFGGAKPSPGSDVGGCSSPLGSLPAYPPSSREACNGWGLLFPRSGIYEGGSRSGAALMIAARLKSLGTEVLHTVPGDLDEVWQMVYPQSSSCFREGQNLGLLEVIKGMREESRILGKPNGYLFVVWKKASCCQDIPVAVETVAALAAIKVACVAVPGGT